ncbi:DHA2 family efflux MFS transporter permease subunit [Actinomadura sp. DC4]|uniref:DHA2 family efflux MFS transporter permease subunit n=1 Tax=Actinomadura sp. DC4 TaxID=3055069 RepID=UPI0025AED846|nr:DHA2 family efflux MFS transporter permease subunit [Actinomadura sp. DC4]MDN3359308.1 DHA2 family efflux MFS transporter permease subunit [Actinomadura sp. DC4]
MPSPFPRSRRMALAVLCAGMLMVILDGSIVTVALPAIQRDLALSPSGLTWIVNSYMIAFGGLLLLAGRLGDLLGRRRMFVAGLAVFTVASLLCGLATNQPMLIGMRFLQGAGGAMASAVSLGMLVTHFPEPGERARAIGAFSFVGAAGASIGQVLGGILTEAVSWHWIFFVNLPVGAAAALLAVRVLDPDEGLGLRVGADALGAALVTGGLMLGVYTIVETSRHGWGSARTLWLAALTVVLLAGFVLRQATAAAPLLPLRMFRSRTVSVANLVQALMVSALFGFQILITLYLQNVGGYGPARAGLALLPAAVMIGAVSLGLSARLAGRFGERNVLLAGIALLVVAIGLLTRLPVHAGYVADVLPTMLLAGGFGLAISAITALGMSGAGAGDAGVVSGLFNTAQQVGGALGVAVLSTFAAARTDGLLARGHDRAGALTGGFHVAFEIGTALLVVAFVLTAALLRQPRTPAEEEAPVPAASPAA